MTRLTALLLSPWMFAAALAAPAPPASPDEVLPPQVSMTYTAEADEQAVRIEWTVLPGYYMYRGKFGFTTETADITLGEPVLPPGERKTDEFFGEVETYRDTFVITIPYTRSNPDITDIALDMRLQGCADVGVCYPPQTWSTDVALPFQAAAVSSVPHRSLLAVFGDRSTSGDGAVAGEEFLPPEEAFVFSAEMINDSLLAARWQIHDGYYIYRDQFRFATDSDRVQLGTPQLPPGKPKTDEYFGDTEVYYHNVEIRVPVARRGPEAGEFALRVQSRGCAEDGICYPPFDQDTLVLLPVATGEITAPADDFGVSALSEQDQLARRITDAGLGWVVLSFFGLGLLLAFTPCVLPMVPILTSLIAGEGKSLTPRRGFVLALAYVLGMAVTYTAGGTVAALFGQQIQAVFQQTWIIVLFAALFGVLALAMFGAYELQMPAAAQTRIAQLSGRQRAGTLPGVAVMGALSALIVTACVAPALVATFIVIGQTGEPLRGAVALFAMSLGMGTPLLVVGASAGTLLPRVGPWMNRVKAFFGLLLLGVAIWMLGRVLPAAITMLAWAALVIGTGVAMGGLRALQGGAGRAWRSAGLATLAAGTFITVGGLAGGTNPLNPLKGSSFDGHAVQHLKFARIRSVADLERELAAARAADQPVMLDFYADWCVSCKEMEHKTFTDPAVQAALAPARLIQADVTANNDDDKALLKYFGIYGPPTIAFFGRDGEELTRYRVVGYKPAADFEAHVRNALAADE